MLLERADRTTLADVADVDEAVALAGRIAHRLAVPTTADLPELRDTTEQLAEDLRKNAVSLAHPLPQHVVDAATAAYRELGPDQPDTLVHGDLHYTNILRAQGIQRAEREPWLAIDPKGCIGDPAYDTVALLRSRNEDLFAADDVKSALLRRIAIFAEAAEVDRDRARRWSQARATTAALWGRRYGDPAQVIRASDRIAELLV